MSRSRSLWTTGGLALALVAGLSLLAACSRPVSPAPSEASATILLAAEPTGVNPLVSGGSRSTQDLIDRLFLRLFEEQPDFAERPPTFAPQLAQGWSWSPDGLTLKLTLRDDVRWSDGVPVSSEDVQWTWQVQRDPRVAWRYASLKSAITDIRIRSPRQLDVIFAERSPNQLAQLNEGNILPSHVWRDLPLAEWPSRADWFRDHLVTNGPFTLASWDPQREIELRANPSYHEPGLPGLERVQLRVVPLRQHRLAALVRGDADFVSQLTPAEADRLERVPGVEVRQFWHRQYDYLAWNTRRPLFDDPAVRRALTQAIDRRALVDALWHGRARVGTTAIPANVWAHHPHVEPWPYAPDDALSALGDAGWEASQEGLRRGGQPFSFELLVNAANPIHVDAGVLIQSQLERIGIAVGLRRLDFQTLVSRLDSGDFDAAIGAWGIDTSLDLGYAFHSSSLTEGYNSGGYENRRVDELIEAARHEADVERRRRQLHELQELLHHDQPYTFLWEPPRLDAHRAAFRGVQPNPLSSLFRLRQWRPARD